MNSRTIITGFFIWMQSLALLTASPATTVNSIYDENTNHYKTLGTASINLPYNLLGRIANDFKKYDLWALKGINGDSDNSRKFISILKQLLFSNNTRTNSGFFKMIYDVDLIFPFGQSDESLTFKVFEHQQVKGLLKKFKITLDEDSLVIDTFDLSVSLMEAQANKTIVEFSCTFKLVGIFDYFFSLERYRYNVEWRILKIIENLKFYAEHLKT